ncbi:MAG: hypothetical protein AAGD14_04025, partial [Planctomycetota bacterium]
AGAQEHTLDEIVEIMRKREQATTRYHACYTYEVSWNGTPSPTSSYPGFYSRDGDRVFWRGTQTHARRVDDRIRYRVGARLAELFRVQGSGPDDWRAHLSRRAPPMPLVISPDQFGIRTLDGFYSDLIDDSSTRIVGKEQIGPFRCVKVFHFDVRRRGRDPQLAWLAIDHGYFPVRFDWLHESKKPPAQVAWTLPGGRVCELRARFAVEELTPVDEGLIPTRAYTLFPKWEGSANVSKGIFTVTPSSVVPGSLLTEDYFTLQHVRTAIASGDAVPVSSTPLSRDEIAEFVKFDTPVPDNNVRWWLMIAGGVTLLLGLLMALFTRARSSRR